MATETANLRRVVRDFQPDIVHLNSSKAGLVGRLLLRGRVKTAYSPHAWSFDAVSGRTAQAALAWERLAARWTHAMICVSRAERDSGVARGIRAPYVVVRNGVDTRSMAFPTQAMRDEYRKLLGIPIGTRVVVCIGRLQRQKGQDLLLSVWPELARVNRRLYLVGDGPDGPSLIRSARRLDRVEFVGEVDRSMALLWMAAADVVAVPSRWEGMALVPLESLAQGTPVVASDVAGVREAITPACGEVVPPEEPQALFEALSRWLAFDDSHLGRARAHARERAVREFDLSATLAELDLALRSAVDAP